MPVDVMGWVAAVSSSGGGGGLSRPNFVIDTDHDGQHKN